ncbi:MAG: PDZ domain-containing protein [Planctomycetota bacterium]
MGTIDFLVAWSCALAVTCAAVAGPAARGAELWVSPRGDDGNPGTEAKPLKTFRAAQQRVRLIQGKGVVPITVRFAAGTYYLPEPVVFTERDSGSKEAPVTYAAAPGAAAVVISGGQRVQLDWRPYRDGIMQGRVPDGFTSDQLFVNGERQPMARYPNYDPKAQYFQGFAADCTSPQRVARWDDPAGGFVHAMHRSLWGDMHWRITGKKADGTLAMVGGWQNNRQMGAHKKFRFVENIFEELDAPGEWFLDEDESLLYFYPPSDLDLGQATIETVRLRHLVEFRGERGKPVRHIVLRGLTFRHAARTFMANKEPLLRSDWTTYRGGAIFFDGAEDCALRDCVIDQVGGNAVFVNAYNRRIAAVGCHIANAGASAVSFVGDPKALRSPLFEYHQTQTLAEMDKTPGPKSPDYPADCLVEDCLIHGNGRVEKQTAGVNIAMAESITVRHCSVYDCPRAGINICDGAFGGHLIEFCDVFDTVEETGDHGSFNSWGRDRFWHKNRSQTVKWVKQHPEMPKWDCRKTIVLRNNRWRCDHGWDIDLDDGSSNYRLVNNLCLAGGIKLREGYFRTVTNNVLVNYTFCPHVWYPDCHTTVQRNILWRDRYAPAGMRTTDQGARIDDNLVHRPGAEPGPAEGLAKFGGDRHSLIADAQFIDPLAGDYRVRDGSPALELGFENFPMDRFGVRKLELRKIARTPPLPGTLEAAKIRSGGWGRRYRKPQTAHWLGATVKNIETRGEMSAVGLGDRNGVLLTRVPKDSRAHEARLRENDVIRAVNGKRVKNLEALADLYRVQARRGEVTLGLWRDQADHTLTVEGP